MHKNNKNKLFQIHEAARACGLSRSTLMRMEAKGLLTPAHVDPDSGRRYYDNHNVARIMQIEKFKAMGLGSKEIADYFAQGGEAEVLLEALETRLRDLQRSVEEMRLRAAEGESLSVQMMELPAVTCRIRWCEGLTTAERYRDMYDFYGACVRKGCVLSDEPLFTISERTDYLEGYIGQEPCRYGVCVPVRKNRAAADAVARLDALCSLAAVAVKNNYCRPSVDESGVIEIQAGRHPVVEKMRPDALFVPNDTLMGAKEERVSIITGPNMAGKSTYMRQVALIVLMAQVGSFVPARSARIGVVDRIFTRIGASDDLSAGQSTFMVEMTEVSDILRTATKNSLLILDEIGRGTSTFDGMSIARAVLEHCAEKLKAKTLFATHYHELTALEQTLPNVRNYNIAVRARGEDIIFLRKIVPGGADRSYGIEVAKLAGLPDSVLKRARAILEELESQSGRPAPAAAPDDQLSLSAMAESETTDIIRRTQVDSLSPLEALNLLYELKKRLG